MASTSTPPPAEDANQARNWAELPRDVTAAILQKVGAVDRLQSAQRVCTSWRSICKDPATWRSIEIRNVVGEYWDMEIDWDKMARHAVDLSCGQLVDLCVEFFGNDEFLLYLSERVNQLRRLQLICCYSISDGGLSESAKRFPLLEELDIRFCSLSKEALINVGRSCPQLKSLKFNKQGSRIPHMEDDDDALAIAETMPGLHHLQLIGNRMTNDGVKAILDGCPDLVSLDLRQCYNVNLGGAFGRRCAERIKYLWLPHDSTDDCGFGTALCYGDDDDFSFDDDYPSGFSEIDYMSDVDDDEYYEFSCGSDISEYGELFFDD